MKTYSTLADLNTVPEVASSSPDINFSKVDFPIPFGPTTVKRNNLSSSEIEHIAKSKEL
jgi:hypothetical protein